MSLRSPPKKPPARQIPDFGFGSDLTFWVYPYLPTRPLYILAYNS
ncbi:hypothetical protein [Metallosphaera turreted icosahedral virus 3]|nr:hypothetical protein [Metallosphaera turreted icosahedral virus 3]WHA35148.1 hypothetical protein MTIV3_ORF6 [Metallosphaera turreted icosahedral virus 3]